MEGLEWGRQLRVGIGRMRGWLPALEWPSVALLGDTSPQALLSLSAPALLVASSHQHAEHAVTSLLSVSLRLASSPAHA